MFGHLSGTEKCIGCVELGEFRHKVRENAIKKARAWGILQRDF